MTGKASPYVFLHFLRGFASPRLRVKTVFFRLSSRSYPRADAARLNWDFCKRLLGRASARRDSFSVANRHLLMYRAVSTSDRHTSLASQQTLPL
jgi:hypothetical protein